MILKKSFKVIVSFTLTNAELVKTKTK